MYPLKFQPIFQKRLWGGQRLRTHLAKPLPPELHKQPIGESWELADLPPGTVKADSTGAAADGSFSNKLINGPFAGKTLHQLFENSEFRILNPEFTHFPLLIKFLDAQQDLSVQVHPDANYCRNRTDAHLKSEAWYILHADPGSKIYKGLKPGTTRDQFRAALETGDVAPLLNAITVRPGDCHYLPSGTVHALGAGILAAEVQTPSDTTFRVFDWNRLGADGKPRALHIEPALACIDFETPPSTPTTESPANTDRLATCEYFTIDRIRTPQSAERELSEQSPAVWIMLEGQAVINVDGPPLSSPTALAKGDTILLPIKMRKPRVKTITDCTWLEVRWNESRTKK